MPAEVPPLPRREPEVVALAIRPSSVRWAGGGDTGQVHPLSGRVRPVGDVLRSDRIGEAVHAFLAGDDRSQRRADRERRAMRCLEASGVAGWAQPDDLVRNAEALWSWAAESFGAVEVLREWPVRWHLPDGRWLVGEIDLLLRCADGWRIVDHKTFPGDAAGRDERVRDYAGQLAAYAAAVEAATGSPVRGLYLHFPVRGEVVEVRVPDGAWAAWLAGGGDVLAPQALPPEPPPAPRPPEPPAPVVPQLSLFPPPRSGG